MTWMIPAAGTASLTHYDLPLNYLASYVTRAQIATIRAKPHRCGCAYGASYHATAALSSLAYSGDERQSIGPGPGCGRCFRLTLRSAHGVDPPFVPADPKPSVVVKIVDKCPSPEFCAATRTHPNKIGQQIHFDLALPSPALNLSFFPSNVELYGYSDFGIWNIDYETVSCEEWAGWTNASSLGVERSYPGYEESCCPTNPPYTNEVCAKSIKAPPPATTYKSPAASSPPPPNPRLIFLCASAWLSLSLTDSFPLFLRLLDTHH
ncbi:uncharacterized protein PGTG_10217 [Puccinia graminis f. sp. tritici CRL 75-36-700-3]|uniref:Expansin-like EG45 domain-containing protein n=1 Tax=Puccinia graminis f. sp. tritici (strain CRL 75-36-700-3 / race SCCL) TaxID=418459 RepID=E3KJM2_PUCGT|nr:uncharacterized protein PGTG_10217 [Puccinia graminis f. sp. tritici CRL 75-36-700-3]EFP84497.2 hypothetical protein PGTG_10217 [Puccinia graminis f. sp. tritici CRL 75-36-700-3]